MAAEDFADRLVAAWSWTAAHGSSDGVEDAVPGLSPSERLEVLHLHLLEAEAAAEVASGRVRWVEESLRVARASGRVFALWQAMVRLCREEPGVDEPSFTDSEVAAALRLFLAEVELRAPWDPREVGDDVGE